MSQCISNTRAEFPPTMWDQLSNHPDLPLSSEVSSGQCNPFAQDNHQGSHTADFLDFSLPPFSLHPQVLFFLKEILSMSHTPPILCKLRSCGPLPGLTHSPPQAPCPTPRHAPPQSAMLGTSIPIPHRMKPAHCWGLGP